MEWSMKTCKLEQFKPLATRIASLVAVSFLAPGMVLAHGPNRGYQQVNLTADRTGLATQTDTNLLNPWGLLIGQHGKLSVVDNHSDQATFYEADGSPTGLPIHVDGGPTGIVMNHSRRDFRIRAGTNAYPSVLIFAGEEGTILAWNPVVDPSNAVVVASSSNAV